MREVQRITKVLNFSSSNVRRQSENVLFRAEEILKGNKIKKKGKIVGKTVRNSQ